MAQINENDLNQLHSIIDEIAEMLQMLEAGRRFFILAEPQQEVAILEMRKRFDSANKVLLQMADTVSEG